MMQPGHKGKLLYVINHMDWFFSHRLPLALEAQERGWDVHVAAAGAENDRRLAVYGFKGIALPEPKSGMDPFKELQIVFAIRKAITDVKPDLVHAITLKYVLTAGLAAQTVPQCKMVYTIAGLGALFDEHSKSAKALRPLILPALRSSLKRKNTHVVLQNPDDYETLSQYNLLQPEHVTIVKSSGVNLAEFCYSQDWTSKNPIVLMATRLLKQKGVMEFCEAAKILKEQGIEARFQIAGGTDPSDKRYITEEELKPYIGQGIIEFLGKVNNMPELLKDASIVTLPSYYREGVPKVLLEAAAIGRPIVTTNYVGCKEVVEDGKNGFLVEIKDAKALASALKGLVENPDLRRAMGKEGRMKANQEFSSAMIAEQTCDLYDLDDAASNNSAKSA